jgi:hypothetical protein
VGRARVYRLPHWSGKTGGIEMSAFLVSDTHIDTLVSLAIEGPRGRAPKYPGDGWPAPYFLRPNNTRERSRYEYGTDIGRMLVHENERSMTARYRYEPGDPNAYEYRMPVKRATAIEGLKAIDCYEYQACETGKAFYESRAYDFLTALRSALIGTLPGYDEASWSVDGPRGGAPNAA